MTAWRLVGDDGTPAARGLALDEALAQGYARGAAPEHAATLRLYTYRSTCALVGRYQSLEHEVDLAACRRLGVEVSRRPTGGGAIVMGAGQLGVAVATRAPVQSSPRDVLREYAQGLIEGLATLGVHSSFRAKNDLEVDGRKIAGLGLYLDAGGGLLFHASVLADLDIAFMLSVLRIPGAKLSHRGLDRVADRVTTVSRETGTALDGAALRPAIAAGFESALGVRLEPGEPTAHELAAADGLEAGRYGADDWVIQRSMRGDAEGTVAFRTPQGLARVFVGVHGDAIKSVLVAGDYNSPPRSLTRLEAELRWCPAQPAAIADRVDRALAGDGELLGCAGPEIAAAVWDAAQRAIERSQPAHPRRAEGSCYFPETEVPA